MLSDLPDLVPTDLLLPKYGQRGGETERRPSLDVVKHSDERSLFQRAITEGFRRLRAYPNPKL